MGFISSLSVWSLAGLIFLLRIVDVSIGTTRTISVVNGRIRLSVFLGFFEVAIWITAIAQVVLRISEHPILVVAYAGGFACGNALGIALERKMALGRCVVRMITGESTSVVQAAREHGHVLGTFRSDLPESPRTLVFTALERRALPRLLRQTREIDPELFWVVERFSETSHLTPLPHATGWRAVFKKK